MAIKQVDASIWPMGKNSPLMLLPFNPDDLSDKFGLVFVDGEDDLGELKVAVVRSPDFGTAGLIRYRDAPFEGTTVYVSSEADLQSTREAVLRGFGLTESDVSWITTDLRHPT